MTYPIKDIDQQDLIGVLSICDRSGFGNASVALVYQGHKEPQDTWETWVHGSMPLYKDKRWTGSVPMGSCTLVGPRRPYTIAWVQLNSVQVNDLCMKYGYGGTLRDIVVAAERERSIA